MFKRWQDRYTSMWKAIVRPPRREYEADDLGPEKFHIGKRAYKRDDIEIKNSRGLTLHCSHFQPVDRERAAQKLPCVIYMHGNSSCRLEALAYLSHLLPHSITLFCFDFSGSGMSEGEYVSLGWYEREDLAAVVSYLRGTGSVSAIGLWGRSMGAATALMLQDRDELIQAMVLDSSFASFRQLARELASSYVKVPNFVLYAALALIGRTIRQRCGFEIRELKPLRHVAKCNVPAMFGAAEGDDFVKPHHSSSLHESYGGINKELVTFPGNHNSMRPKSFFDKAIQFMKIHLRVDELPPPPEIKSRSKPAKPLPEIRSYSIRGRGSVSGAMKNVWEEDEELIRQAVRLTLQKKKVLKKKSSTETTDNNNNNVVHEKKTRGKAKKNAKHEDEVGMLSNEPAAGSDPTQLYSESIAPVPVKKEQKKKEEKEEEAEAESCSSEEEEETDSEEEEKRKRKEKKERKRKQKRRLNKRQTGPVDSRYNVSASANASAEGTDFTSNRVTIVRKIANTDLKASR
eukprot:GILK01009684.1.p1 GENE.GILK01009684.1~~GILK01009684.1.p1  ORF type:complete len:515 (-),score=111.24 GILK01009684.1:87-1631(-)